ncbi:hypothetical protein BSNK01_18980 [Bacillaceae bacterium]
MKDKGKEPLNQSREAGKVVGVLFPMIIEGKTGSSRPMGREDFLCPEHAVPAENGKERENSAAVESSNRTRPRRERAWKGRT